MTTQGPRRLTPRVRDLVAADRQVRSVVGPLTADELQELIAVARGDVNVDVPVSTRRAVSALGERADPVIAVPILGNVLLDDRRQVPDRLAAARGLVGIPDADDLLLRAAADAEPRLRQEALEVLGRAAGPRIAPALEALRVPEDPSAARQLAFTRALVAHRAGSSGPFLPDVGSARVVEPLPGGPSDVELGMRTAQETSQDVRRLRGSRYGMEVGDRAINLRCGATRWSILVNRDLGRELEHVDRLFERPWIAGVLAQEMPRGEALTTRLVLLSRPLRPGGQDATARLDLVRADGEVIYTGRASRSDAGLLFELRDTEREGGVPTSISAVLQPDVTIRTRTAVVARSRKDDKTTRSVVVS